MQSRLANAETGASVAGGPVFRRFAEQARTRGAAVAVLAQDVSISYAQLHERAERAASLLVALGVCRGDRLAILAENRPEFLELQLAAAKLGAIVACQNWRLAPAELHHCLKLVEPRILFVSARYRDRLRGVEHQIETHIEFGADYERRLADAPTEVSAGRAGAEDNLVILYTSGTTGFPKAATISQRALVARMEVWRTDFGFDEHDAFLAWSPLFHMAANDQSFAALMSGGTVILENGFEPERIAHWLSQHRVGWFLLVPGVIDPMIAWLANGGPRPLGVKVVGSMADLVAPESIRQITRLVGAPYLNSFGATETGMPPLSKGAIPVDNVPTSLSKQPSSSCEIRLVASDWSDVPPDEPGEVAMRGPTLFSGYWTPQGFNRADFSADGFFRMGDVFRRNRDGDYDFVDRAKYLIKSGGENVYPAEIERVLLAAPHVREACVVKRRDEKWGEVPVAFVATDGTRVEAAQLQLLCKQHLAGYKCPREFLFIDLDTFPRSTTGKIMRHEMEKRLG